MTDQELAWWTLVAANLGQISREARRWPSGRSHRRLARVAPRSADPTSHRCAVGAAIGGRRGRAASAGASTATPEAWSFILRVYPKTVVGYIYMYAADLPGMPVDLADRFTSAGSLMVTSERAPRAIFHI